LRCAILGRGDPLSDLGAPIGVAREARRDRHIGVDAVRDGLGHVHHLEDAGGVPAAGRIRAPILPVHATCSD